MAFDQATSTTGWAFGDIQPGGQRVQLIKHGDIQLKSGSLGARLIELGQDIGELLRDFQPARMVIEGHNYHGFPSPDTILAMAGAAAVCHMEAIRFGIKCDAINISTWRDKLGVKAPKTPKARPIKERVLFPGYKPPKKDPDAIKRVCRNLMMELHSIPLEAFKSLDQAEAIGILTAYPRVFEVMS
jgi:hypothetical protein